MISYYVLALLPPIVSYFIFSNKEQQKKRTKLMLALFFGVFLFLVAFRHFSVGIDNNNYRSIFESISQYSWRSALKFDIEPLYAILNKSISLFTDDFHTVMIVVALISIIPIAVMYTKESENGLLTMVLFMSVAPFSIYFSTYRQIIAIAFIVPAYYLTKHKKPIWFILTVVIAILFHQSAFIMLLIYPIYHLNITTNKFLILVPSIVLIYIFNGPIFKFITSMMSERYAERYGELETTGAIMMILLFVMLVAFSYLIADDKKLDKDTVGLRNILVLVLVLQLFSPVNFVAMRMNYYFILFIPILMPRIINRAKAEYRQIAVLANVVMCIFFAVYFFYNAYAGEDVLQIFPYKFMWE